MSNFKFNVAVVLSAGKSKRMKTVINKNLLLLDNKPIIYHTLKKFNDVNEINFIILVINKNDRLEMEKVIASLNFRKPVKLIFGGKTRQASVINGLKECLNIISKFGNFEEKILSKNVIILIHNGCNPFTTAKEIREVIQGAKREGFCLVGQKINDTIKEVVKNRVTATIDRKNKWLAQTPQAMQIEIAEKILRSSKDFNFTATDDSQLAERLGYKPNIIPCSPFNFKITTKEELEKAKFIVLNQNTSSTKRVAKSKKEKRDEILIGIGKDSHRFGNTSNPLILAGVRVPYYKGFVAHSDGDVIYHAIFNAISSALGERSIGFFFSDKDALNKNRNSADFFSKIYEILKKRNCLVRNVSIIIEGKEPHLEQYVEKMKKNISKTLKIKSQEVGIIITSGEELTPFGKGEGIECTAYVSIKKV